MKVQNFAISCYITSMSLAFCIYIMNSVIRESKGICPKSDTNQCTCSLKIVISGLSEDEVNDY